MTRHPWRVLAAPGNADARSSPPAAAETTTNAQARTTTAGDDGAAANVSGAVSVMGIWIGEEQKSFQAVIDGFNEV